MSEAEDVSNLSSKRALGAHLTCLLLLGFAKAGTSVHCRFYVGVCEGGLFGAL